jgi:hypothetical protein
MPVDSGCLSSAKASSPSFSNNLPEVGKKLRSIIQINSFVFNPRIEVGVLGGEIVGKSR